MTAVPPAVTQRGDRRFRRAVITTALRAGLTSVVLVVAYYALPLRGRFNVSDSVVLGIGFCLFLGLSWHGTRGILRSDLPGLRAVRMLGTVLPFFLILFAATYYLMSTQNPASFSQRMTHTDALYFTLTVFSTVGFGDIAAVSEPARAIVTVQMLGDLALIGLGVKVLAGAVNLGRQRRDRSSLADDPVQEVFDPRRAPDRDGSP
jgi:hypothetical protein